MSLESAYTKNLLQAVLTGLYEAKTEASLASYNLYAMRDTAAYTNVEGVYVLLTELLPRLDSAYSAIAEALQETPHV